MKTVYIPKGETVHYESLTTEHLVVHGRLRVTYGVKAQSITGSGVIDAGSINADTVCIDDVESGTVICKRLIAKRVQAPEVFASESAAVSCFLSAAYRALSTTVGKLLFSVGKSVLSFEVPVMYGIEYEDDILLLLRMIKFLHMQSPDAAHIFCQSHPVVDMEELLMVIDEVMWDIFDDVNFFFDEEYEATVVQCSHPIIDRLYEQGRASDPKHGSRQSVWSKKLHDITEYFVLGATNSVYKFSQHIAGDHVILEFCLSPDYYEPLYFANSLVDLLRYCQCSIRRIEAKLAERETENIRKEAA